jgi:hypothetical protein
MYSAAQARPSHLAGAAYRASGAYQTIGSSLYGLRSYGGKIGKMQWCLLFSGAVASTVCSVDWITSTRNMMNSMIIVNQIRADPYAIFCMISFSFLCWMHLCFKNVFSEAVDANSTVAAYPPG